MPDSSIMISFRSRYETLEAAIRARYGEVLGSFSSVRLFVVNGPNWQLQLLGCCNQNLAAPTGRLDHEWWIVIELAGWVWCDDDHVFGKSIFCGFGGKLLIFLRFCGMEVLFVELY